ncbi:EF-hand calcium-binding domain-containing protein 1 [Geranomyces michiganensis]|nr:EF-hand calcium-binding domain-containing protein 1 [Geranomyces michiganensis]
MAARASPDELLKTTNFTRQEVEVLQHRFAGLIPAQPVTSYGNGGGGGGGGGGSGAGGVGAGGAVGGGAGGADRDPLAALYAGKIDRARFRDLLADGFGVDDSLLMDRVFRTFDTDADNYISYEEFIKGMSVFLKGRVEERTRYCFRVYDLNGDRYISKEEMYQMLRNCLVRGQEEDEDGVKDLVDLVLKKLDEDRDGRVSEADWTAAIGKELLLMEAFGQCLPRNKTIEQYLSMGSPSDASSASGAGSKSLRLGAASARGGGLYHHYHPGRNANTLASNAPLANSTSSIASDLATEAAQAMLQQAPSHHKQISKHVHPHHLQPRRVVVAPAAGMQSGYQSPIVPRSHGRGAAAAGTGGGEGGKGGAPGGKGKPVAV